MNIRGRDVLMGAAVTGVRQLRGQDTDRRGGFCTIGLLLDSIGCEHLGLPNEWYANPDNKAAHDACMALMAETYEITYDEWMAIKHENDVQQFDFLTIAWMHCRPSEQPEISDGS